MFGIRCCYRWLMTVQLSDLLGLLFGEMVTNLLIIPGDCCIGGVRHILSSFSVLGVISSPTRILSRLPSSTPFPNHLPHGNLHNKHILLIVFLRTVWWKQYWKWVSFSQKTHSLVSVPCDLIAHHDTLHKPLCVEPRVIVTHLHRGQLAKVLALRGEKRTVTSGTKN